MGATSKVMRPPVKSIRKLVYPRKEAVGGMLREKTPTYTHFHISSSEGTKPQSTMTSLGIGQNHHSLDLT
jgi:hypothetical protein